MSDTHAAAGIDPRGPRFVAGITAALLLVATFLGLTGLSMARLDAAGASFGWFAYEPIPSAPAGIWAITFASVGERAADPGFILLTLIAALFLWGVVSPRTAPSSALFRTFVQPRLPATVEREDPRPPRFAQGVGLVVTSLGLILHLAGVPWALPVAAAAAFIAAFLNAVFGLCLGCQLYLGMQRIGIIGRTRSA